MKSFEKHGEECNCPQCMFLMVLRRIDTLEEALLYKKQYKEKPTETKNQSAFEKTWRHHERIGGKQTRKEIAKYFWNGAIARSSKVKVSAENVKKYLTDKLTQEDVDDIINEIKNLKEP
jgi:hypothetical protein